ncbi:MAG: enoyl-CoA hydratase/isomerase family protein [Pigmentiphaga sp.]|nr:enoyl-CoA hydratase/isomerase family protein [Pigmentiphaga sp.]
MTSPYLQIARTGPLLTLTLARPAQRNALNTALCEQLLQALDEASRDEHLQLLVLDAQGPLFCAGADLKEFAGQAPDLAQAARARRLELLQRLTHTLREHRLPTLAVVHGAAIGAGANLALCCDQVLIASTAYFHYPELAHGIDPSSMIPMLAQHLGRKQLTDVLWMGERIQAAQAQQWGLVSAVAEPGQLDTVRQQRCERLLSYPPQALQSSKRAVLKAYPLSS